MINKLFAWGFLVSISSLAQSEVVHFHYEGVVTMVNDRNYPAYLFDHLYTEGEIVSGTLTLNTEYLSTYPPRVEVHNNWLFGTEELRYYNQPSPEGETVYREPIGDQRLVTGWSKDVGSTNSDNLILRDQEGSDYLRLVDGYFTGGSAIHTGENRLLRQPSDHRLILDIYSPVNFVNSLTLEDGSFEALTLADSDLRYLNSANIQMKSLGQIVGAGTGGNANASNRGYIEPYQYVSFDVTSVTIEVLGADSAVDGDMCYP
jgi:hypothetical protein